MNEKIISAAIFALGVLLLASIRKVASIYIGKQKRLYVHMGQHTPSNYLQSGWYELYIYLLIIMTSMILVFVGLWGLR